MGAVRGYHRVISLWQTADKRICVGNLRRPFNFLLGSIQFSKPDIVRHRSCKQMGVLQYNSKRMAQGCLADVPHVNSVINNRSTLHIIETVDQIGNGGFSCSRGAYKGNLLSWLRIQADILQNHPILIITEVHMLKPYIPSKRHQLPTWLLPRPGIS